MLLQAHADHGVCYRECAFASRSCLRFVSHVQESHADCTHVTSQPSIAYIPIGKRCEEALARSRIFASCMGTPTRLSEPPALDSFHIPMLPSLPPRRSGGISMTHQEYRRRVVDERRCRPASICGRQRCWSKLASLPNVGSVMHRV